MSKYYILVKTKIFKVEDDLSTFEITFKEMISEIEHLHNNLRGIMDGFVAQSDELEDLLFDMKTPRHFVNTWFQTKRELALIGRAFSRNIIVLQQYFDLIQLSQKENAETVRILIQHLNFDRRNCAGESNKLEAMFNYFNSLKNEKMNSNIYLLALVSGVFLPLNLVVGFFGMNTENLFFHGNPKGTMNVVSILIGLFILLLLGLPLLKLIDFLIFRQIFKRYDVYQKLHKKIHSIKFSLSDD